MELDRKTIRRLAGRAEEASRRCYAPYSRFAVGAAVLVAALTVLDRLSGGRFLALLRLDKLLFLALLVLAAAGLHALFLDQLAPLVRRAFEPERDRSERLVSILSGGGILLVVAVAGSVARMTASPTRTASAPAAAARRISAFVRTPLSATRTRSAGMRESRP